VKTTATKHRTGGKVEPSIVLESCSSSDTEDRVNCIAMAAYFMAEARGFMPGQELDDWLEAEAKVDARKGH